MIDEPADPTEPRWLLWAREIQALAQTGLAFTRDQYDRERYQRLRALAAQIMAEHTGLEAQDIELMFTQQTGYATPKLGVRGAVFRDDRLLLVRETADEHRWTLPGGWADVNESPAEAVAREVREEAGVGCAPTSSPQCGTGPSSARNDAALPRLAAVLPVRDHWRRARVGTGDERSGFFRGARVADRAINPADIASPNETHVRAHAPTGPANRLRLTGNRVNVIASSHRPSAGTDGRDKPGHDGESEAKSEPGLVLGAQPRLRRRLEPKTSSMGSQRLRLRRRPRMRSGMVFKRQQSPRVYTAASDPRRKDGDGAHDDGTLIKQRSNAPTDRLCDEPPPGDAWP